MKRYDLTLLGRQNIYYFFFTLVIQYCKYYIMLQDLSHNIHYYYPYYFLPTC